MPEKVKARVRGYFRPRNTIVLLPMIPLGGMLGDGKYCVTDCDSPSIANSVKTAATPGVALRSRSVMMNCQNVPNGSLTPWTEVGAEGTMEDVPLGVVICRRVL